MQCGYKILTDFVYIKKFVRALAPTQMRMWEMGSKQITEECPRYLKKNIWNWMQEVHVHTKYAGFTSLHHGNKAGSVNILKYQQSRKTEE